MSLSEKAEKPSGGRKASTSRPVSTDLDSGLLQSSGSDVLNSNRSARGFSTAESEVGVLVGVFSLYQIE